MPRRRNAAPIAAPIAITIAVTVAVALSGCVQSPAPVIPTVEPTSRPVFASDAAALAAAKKAFAAYLSISDLVASEGGSDPQRFAPVVSSSWLVKETSAAAVLSKSKRRQEGTTSVVDMKLQQRTQVGPTAHVSTYACLDLSKVDYVDADSGLDPTDPSKSLVPITIDYSSSKQKNIVLIIERIAPWQGANFCPQS